MKNDLMIGSHFGALTNVKTYGNPHKKRKQPFKHRRLVWRYQEPNWEEMTVSQAWNVARDLYDGPASKVVGIVPGYKNGKIVPAYPEVVVYDGKSHINR